MPGRTAKKVARALKRNKDTVKDWCAANKWVARAQAWDDHIAALEDAAAEQTARDFRRKFRESYSRGPENLSAVLIGVETGRIHGTQNETATGALQVPARERRAAALDRMRFFGLIADSSKSDGLERLEVSYADPQEPEGEDPGMAELPPADDAPDA